MLALVAGGALKENIVNEIEVRGSAFRPSNQYSMQLETAGADAAVLATLKNAKITTSAQSAEDKHHIEFLEHLTQAAGLMRNKRYNDAVRELNASLAAGPESAAVGFVMGNLLLQREQWAAAVSVYNEVLSRDPDFPEVHTRLAFSLYKLGDEELAISEAKAALRRTPENAEAHKNMGLAWEVWTSRQSRGCSFSANETAVPNSSLLQHDYVSAERYYSRALALNEATFGPTNRRAKNNLDELAGVYIHQRNFEKAERCLQRSLAIDEALYGPDYDGVPGDAARLGDMSGIGASSTKLSLIIGGCWLSRKSKWALTADCFARPYKLLPTCSRT